MQRDRLEYRGDPVHIARIWNLFVWDHCECCKKEFRRKSGWEHLVPRYNRPRYRYVCAKCCPTKRDVLGFFTETDDYVRNNRPAPPPCPPRFRQPPPCPPGAQIRGWGQVGQ